MLVHFNQPPRDRRLFTAALFYVPGLLIGGGLPIFLLADHLGEGPAFGLSVVITLAIAAIAHLHFRCMLIPMSAEATKTGMSFVSANGSEATHISWDELDYSLIEGNHGFVLMVYATTRTYLIRQFPTIGKAPEGFAELCEAIEQHAVATNGGQATTSS